MFTQNHMNVRVSFSGVMRRMLSVLGVALMAGVIICTLGGCAANQQEEDKSTSFDQEVNDKPVEEAPQEPTAEELRAQLSITEDYRDSFAHGNKGADFQKYIVLHDTESNTSAAGIVDYWDGNGTGVAAHFIINKDGTIVQCVPLDTIAHHAGFGDTGHNAQYGVEDESRDDKVGTTSIGSWASDYGMNSYSVGIEMVHVGATDSDYPAAQLEALDTLIAYIDAYYGFESDIIDHKAWRTGNSDTSAEFATYLANYQQYRTHDGQ